MRKATKNDWQRKVFTQKHISVNTYRLFTKDEMTQICMGYIPEVMENKWFIYCEKEKLFFHRSWTGTLLFVAYFRKEKDHYALFKVDLNRDPEQYTAQNDEEDIQIINNLIDRLLLHKHIDISKGGLETTLSNWSMYGSAMLEEDNE